MEAYEIRDFLAELQWIHPFGKVGSDRGKNVSRMKSVAHGLKVVVFRSDVTNVQALLTSVDEREHAVVGSDKMMPFGGDYDRSPRRPYAGIDDHQVHGAIRKVGISLGDGQGTVQDIKYLHGMTDVHDLS